MELTVLCIVQCLCDVFWYAVYSLFTFRC